MFREFAADRFRAGGQEIENIRPKASAGASKACPRGKVLARHDIARQSESAHFNSHQNAEALRYDSTKDPISGQHWNSKICGLGPCSILGRHPTSIIAADTITEPYPDFPGPIEICASGYEEPARLGDGVCTAEQGYFNQAHFLHVIIPES